MEIIKTIQPIKKGIGKGREPKYPFRDLKPGYTLVINLVNEGDRGRITAAFWAWKKYNNPNFKVVTQFTGSKLLIHAI